MATALEHRGPDSEGVHQRGDVGFAVRRLKVIDLVTGDQPIRSVCSGAVIVYNGELYNYRELRAELRTLGHRFTTASDTEVVLHFYEEYGPTAFHRLNGIFAFAIDDPRHHRVLIARDQLGVKPLYYATVGDALVFASESKALFASGTVPRRIDRSALAMYLTYGHATGPRTMYEGIVKLPAGSVLVRDPMGSTVSRYWDVVGHARRWPSDAEPPIDEITELIEDAIGRNMLAEVPVGAFLSGGIDSSLVTVLMRRHTDRLHTYSVGFGLPTDESPHAMRVASTLGTIHTAITVDPAAAARAIADVSNIYDEPFADEAAVPTYLMSKRAREDVTVVLTGEGGDELFGGYRRYVAEQAYALVRALPDALLRAGPLSAVDHIPWLRRFGQSVHALRERERVARYSVWTETFHADERCRLLDGHDDPGVYARLAELVPPREAIADDVTAMMVFELRTWLVDAYLEKVDKATMAASLEARVPLLDPRLVELMALAPRRWKIKGSATKVLLRQIASRWLEPATVERRKRGFGPPIGSWLRSSLQPEVDAMLEPGSAIGDIVDRDATRSLVHAFRRGEWRERQVWSLLMLALWAERERTDRMKRVA